MLSVEGDSVTVKVEGMMCPHCEATVKEALEQLDFVSSANADHIKGTVEISLSGPFDLESARKSIKDKGYRLIG